MVVRFVRYLGLAVRGDFGISYRNLEPVSRVLLSRVPATLELALCAAVLALGIGIPLGVYAGIKRNTWPAQWLQVISLVGISVPSFLTGIILILDLLGRAQLAACLRPRPDGLARRLDHRPPHDVGTEVADHAVGHAGAVPAHAVHAARALRDARGTAHRLHQVRAGARHRRALDLFPPRACATR